MNSLKKTFLPLLISAATLVVGFWLLEKNYQHELQKMGWLPRINSTCIHMAGD